MNYKIDLWYHIYIWEKTHTIRAYSKILKVSICDKSNHSLLIYLSEQEGYYLNEK